MGESNAVGHQSNLIWCNKERTDEVATGEKKRETGAEVITTIIFVPLLIINNLKTPSSAKRKAENRKQTIKFSTILKQSFLNKSCARNY